MQKYRIFKSFFDLRVLYCTPTLFCAFDHLPTVAARSYLFIFFGSKSDTMRLCNEQTKVMYTYFPKNVPDCDKSQSDILIQFQALQHIWVFLDF